MLANRSYLYVPGHDADALAHAFEHGTDAIVLDLEDGVPPEKRDQARALVAQALRSHPDAWVRINPAETHEALADLKEVAALAAGIRVPKTTGPDDVRWVAERAPGTRLIFAIETARGVLAAAQIAATPGLAALSLGAGDLAAELGCEPGDRELLHVRSHLVIASRAAGIAPPIDSVCGGADLDGLRSEAEAARRLGFVGKSTLDPSHVATIKEAFTRAV